MRRQCYPSRIRDVLRRNRRLNDDIVVPDRVAGYLKGNLAPGGSDPVEPIPESAETIDEIARSTDDTAMRSRIQQLADRIHEVVPDCVGISLTALEQGVTITLVASTDLVDVLDATQYLDDGPCEQSVRQGETVDVVLDTLDEQTWQLFARAAAARGVASTLSLPLVEDDRVVGGVNLYGASEHCFDGQHERLAEIVGSDAVAAVTNADLGFSTRTAARAAPEVLRATALIDVAAGMLAAARGTSPAEAQERIRRAAARAGVTERRVAEIAIELLEPRGPD